MERKRGRPRTTKRGPKPNSPRLTGALRVAGQYRVNPENGCWEWSRCRNKMGYGRLGISQRTMLAHRYVWTWLFGPIPDGLNVLHKCDNPPCIRPDHLFLGTHADNVADMCSKGRQVAVKGEAVGTARLMQAQVNEIRQQVNHLSDCELARRYRVHSNTIRYIRIGQTWKCA